MLKVFIEIYYWKIHVLVKYKMYLLHIYNFFILGDRKRTKKKNMGIKDNSDKKDKKGGKTCFIFFFM